MSVGSVDRFVPRPDHPTDGRVRAVPNEIGQHDRRVVEVDVALDAVLAVADVDLLRRQLMVGDPAQRVWDRPARLGGEDDDAMAGVTQRVQASTSASGYGSRWRKIDGRSSVACAHRQNACMSANPPSSWRLSHETTISGFSSLPNSSMCSCIHPALKSHTTPSRSIPSRIGQSPTSQPRRSRRLIRKAAGRAEQPPRHCDPAGSHRRAGV